MGQFIYKAVDRSGSHISGTVDAGDRKAAVTILSQKGEFVTELSEKTAGFAESGIAQAGLKAFKLAKISSQRITGREILAMTNQLSTALKAGLPLLGALKIIHDQQNKPAMRNMLNELVQSVSQGQSLSDAMEGCKNTGSFKFSPLYISMVRVGETGGILEQTTAQLVNILTRDEKIKTNMKNASAYPIFVLCVGIASVIIIINWVLPNILATISGGVAVLPWPTRFLLAISDMLKRYGLLFLIIVGAASYYFITWIRDAGRMQWDTFKLKVPVLGSVLQTIAVGRFARTLGSLTKGGVPILESLSIVRNTLGNELLGSEIDNVAEKVKTGTPLAEPLNASGQFPPLLVQIVSIGEQTGKLDELLLNAAETFDSEADAAINRFIAIFPAFLILLLGVVIGFIIIAVLLPIVKMGLGSGVI